MARRQRQKRLRHRKPHRVGRRHDGGFGHGRMLDQDAFELERADAIVGRFEDIVGAADIGQVAVVVDRSDVAGAIDRAVHRADAAVVGLIALHQSGRPRLQHQADLAFLLLFAVHIEQCHPIARQRPAHRARLHGLARRIADERRGFGLAVTVADGDAPRRLDPFDDFRIERLAGADQFAHGHLPGAQILLDQHAPHRRRRAERGDAAARDGVEQPLGVEAALIDDEDRRLRAPRREEAAPGMLGPAGRRNIEMDVAGFQPDPVDGRQMADRIALVAVQHEFWRRRGARREIKQHRIVRPRLAVGRELRGCLVGFLVSHPARHGAADGDPRIVARQVGEFGGDVGTGDDVADAAAGKAIGEIVAGEQHGRRHDHGAELHRRQHAFPQRHDIAEHQQDAVAAADAEAAQRIGDAVRALAQLGEGELGLARILVDQPQRRLPIAARHRIEIIERPVEAVELRPAEIAVGGRVILAMAQQKFARREEGCRIVRAHVISRDPASRMKLLRAVSAYLRGSCNPRRAPYAEAAAQSLCRSSTADAKCARRSRWSAGRNDNPRRSPATWCG